ncbi:diguanylate cyclase (GGDEF) domain-containing protein [Granulicatella balaenopterae]|uniref:Diguanylate cyclase (GGDEF) domain-containing protein n=2 Tax=Granulicatella balaenopterae TaxID=137733 RepID=A0A1H9KFH4_9LACT|nr:diguanylate cyclase (GGDEF) domain-containing protein [Granulicatella balaenopterae]
MSFIMTEIFILVASSALLYKLRSYFVGQTATIRFKSLVKSFCIYLIIDISWALLVYGDFYSSTILLHFLSMGEFILMGLIPYYWFLYVKEILDVHFLKYDVITYAYKMVMICYCALVVTSFKTGFIYAITSDSMMIWGEYTNGIIVFLLFLFFGTATVYGIINLIMSRNKIVVKKSLMVIGFVVPIVLILFLYSRYQLAICVPQAMFTAIILYFFSLEDQMSYIDELTGLFNRKKLNALALEGKISDSNRDLNEIFYVDVNDFKSINDTYGHLEGDKVLQIIGQALIRLDEFFKSVSIRLGGDEFIVAISDKGINDIDFKQTIRDEISYIAEKEAFPHTIKTSIGSAKIHGNTFDSLDDCLKEADMAMYKDKPKKKNRKR